MQNIEKYKAVQNKINKLDAVTQRIIDGDSTTHACAKYNISLKKYQKFLQINFEQEATEPRTGKYNPNHPETKEFFCWEDRFIYAILGENGVCLPDFYEAYEITTATLKEREREIIRMRFEEDMTLDEISKIFGINRERIRQIEAQALRRLRWPGNSIYFKYGTHSAEVQDIQRKIQAFEDEKAILLKKLREQAQKEEEEVKELKAQVDNLPDAQNFYAMRTPIEKLNLSVRSHHCLIRSGCRTIEDLAKFTSNDLKKVRNLGAKSYKEITTKLYEMFNITLKDA